MKSFFTFLLVLSSIAAFCQTGGISISPGGSAPDPSAAFDVNFTTKGVLMPRLTQAQRDSIVNPAMGLTIFNTDCRVYNFNAGTPEAPDWATINSSNALTAGVSITANPVGAICSGTGVTFTATPSSGISSPAYQWQVNGGNVGSNSSAYTSTGLNNGDAVTCILSTGQACIIGSPATSNSIIMSVNTQPVITGTTPAGFCSGNGVTLGASANLGTINWYSAPTGGSSLSSGASFTTLGLTSTTTYYVDATANGCTTPSRTPVTATFYPNAPAQPGAISGPTSVNVNDTATYSVSAVANAAVYSWSVGDGVITSGQGTSSILVTWNDSAANGSVSVFTNNPCGTSSAQAITVGVQSVVFSYTGSEQTFVVPVAATLVTITVYGAQGTGGNPLPSNPGGTSGGPGGLGGQATGTLIVTPGEDLYVYVGGQAGYNGGGAGGNGNDGSFGTGGVGGGASDVRVGGTALGNRVIVAGGGGGGGGAESAGYSGSAGGTGGGTDGGAGSYNPACPGGCFDATGGTQGSGGSGGGDTECGGNCTAASGTEGQGGQGLDYNSWAGGGGGGGYYGGGGGSSWGGGDGGGGGSGYTGGVNSASMQNGVQSGNGQVVISWQ